MVYKLFTCLGGGGLLGWVPMKKRILIVEDEPAIRVGLTDVLVFHGYAVEAVEQGEAGLAQAQSGAFDLLLLDVMLPGLSGWEILRRVRTEDLELPVIMLTAKAADEDVIQGLSLGADDYVAKPFSVAQLVLRIEAVLRRCAPPQEKCPQIGFADGLCIDVLNLCARRLGQTASFTRREMDLLLYLHAHHLRPVSREELLTTVWGYARSHDIETRTVDIHVAKLRRKIEVDPKRPQNLITVRGGGYRLCSLD